MAGCLKLLLRLLCTAALVGTVNLGNAQNATSSASSALADPTRPPAAMTASEGPSADVKAIATSSGFQAVVLRKRGGKLAVINGETISLGGKLGDARLVSLSETEAVLEGPNGKEVMQMTPGIEKKMKRKQKISAKRRGGRAKHVPKKTESKPTK